MTLLCTPKKKRQEQSENSRRYIVGRDQEVFQINSLLQAPMGAMRPLLLGPSGIGKMAIVEKAARELMPRKLRVIDCSRIAADCIAENQTGTVSGSLKAILESECEETANPPILYLRRIEKIMQMDHVSDFIQSLFKKTYSLIASISEDPKDEKIAQMISTLSALNFFPIPIQELPLNDIQQVVSHHLDRRFLGHRRLMLLPSAIHLGVRLASKYEHSRPSPIKEMQLIERCAYEVLLETEKMHGLQAAATVTTQHIAQFISKKTGIPAEDLMDDALFNEERFVRSLQERIVGQDHAIRVVSKQVTAYKMGLLDPNKPWGIFLFVGPTGVGKTELARNLAKLLFHDEKFLICLDGSEYKESHTVSNLIGAPRGYEGHDSGGMLTEPLMANPNQVVLFDEFEKAHEDVRRLFLQVFDRGVLTDRRGKRVDCAKALFIMTSNLGSKELFSLNDSKKCSGELILEALKPILVEHLSPELCNRFSAIIPFQPLEKGKLQDLVQVQLKQIAERLANQAEISLTWSKEVETYFCSQDIDLRFGMRDFCRSVEQTVIQALKDETSAKQLKLRGNIALSLSSGSSRKSSRKITISYRDAADQAPLKELLNAEMLRIAGDYAKRRSIALTWTDPFLEYFLKHQEKLSLRKDNVQDIVSDTVAGILYGLSLQREIPEGPLNLSIDHNGMFTASRE